MKQQAARFWVWNVYRLSGRLIDTVFTVPDMTNEEVTRGLIDHDGYPADIIVRREVKQ